MNIPMSRIRQKLIFTSSSIICAFIFFLSFSESYAQQKWISEDIPYSSSKLVFLGEEFGMTNRKSKRSHLGDWQQGSEFQ